MQNLKVCFYTHNLPNPLIGGVERVTYNLTNAFRAHNIRVYNLCSFGDGADATIPTELNNSEKAIFANDFLIRNGINILIDQYWMSFLSHPMISENIKILQCCHMNPIAKHTVRALFESIDIYKPKQSLLNIAFIINTPLRNLKLRKRYSDIRETNGIDKLVFLCDNYVNAISSRYKIDIGRLAAIPNAIDDNLLNETSSLTQKKKKTIMWCGRIAQSPKNVLFLPRLWKHLMTKHPDWEMIIVGDGIDRHLLERKIKHYKLSNITLTGNTNPYKYYRDASIFVLPSYSEGFGMVLLEAMANNCVPVVFDNSAVFNDIISEECGFIVPDLDADAFINACDLLISNEDLLLKMGQNAKQTVSRFSMSDVYNQWCKLFNELEVV